MKIHDCFILACKNIIRRIKSSIKIFINFILIAFLFVSFFTLNNAFNEKMNNLLKAKDYEKFISIYQFKPILFEEDQIKLLDNVIDIDYQKMFWRNYNNKIMVNSETIFENSSFYCYLTDINKDQIPYMYRLIAEDKATNTNYLKYGTYISNSNEILISEKLLNNWGYLNAETALGSTISIIDKNEILLDNYEIVGVLDGDLTSNTTYDFNNTIIISQDILNDITINEINYYLLVFYKDLDLSENLLLELREMMPEYEINLNMLDNDYAIKKIHNQKIVINSIISTLGAILIFTLLINILLSLYFITNQKGSFYGIMLANGIKRSSLFFIHWIELLIIYTVSLIISMILLLLISYFLNNTLFNFLNLIINPSTIDLIVVFFRSFLMGLLIVSIISFIIINRIVRQPLKDLLKMNK